MKTKEEVLIKLGEQTKKVNVEFATIYENIKQTLSDANKDFFRALDLKNDSAKLCQNSIKENRLLLKEIEKAESLLKQIGLESELKKVQDARNQVNSNISIIDKALNNFLSI